MADGERPLSRVPALLRRIALLGACIVAGVVIGAVGQHFSGSTNWYLAVPLLVAVAWLFVANPTECLPHVERPSHKGSGRQ